MASLFDFKDYRDAVKFLLDTRGDKTRGSQSRLASFIGCQQAYLSRFFAGQAELSQEQILLIADFFTLDKLEAEYILYLLNFNRAGNGQLKSFYEKKIKQILEKKLEIKSRIKAEGDLDLESKTIYYSDWLYCAVHIITAIDKYRTVREIAERLRVSQQKVTDVLEFLESKGLVVKKNNRYMNKIGSLHLGGDASVIKFHHANWRLQSLNNLGAGSQQNLNYSSVISCGVADTAEIREIIVDAIGKIRKIVKDSPNEEVYCYNFDFFSL